MQAYAIIKKKRDGERLSPEEISWFIEKYVAGEIPDYQVAAWLMAVYIRGLNAAETVALTEALVRSGQRVDLSDIAGIKVDKHSTGGVGDKTTLVLAPLLAAAGAKVAKVSGRGLGHTGGTIDKLESIPGFKTALGPAEFVSQVNRVGVAVVAQTETVVPADKKLYALRDVTATVDSIPLIAASIMSKKLACGADAIVLDVKTGSGAFVQDPGTARELARLMVDIGKHAGRRVTALITDMDQPLGYAVGNAVEVAEAVETLKGRGPLDLTELCLELGTRMLMLAGLATNAAAARARLEEMLWDGRALAKFKEWVAAQGGDPRVADDPGILPQAPQKIPVSSPRAGYVVQINALGVGEAARVLGAGRARKEDAVDPAVGVVLAAKVGTEVEAGEPLAYVLARDKGADEARQLVATAYTIAARPPKIRPLVRAIVEK
ncbi:MAG: pyrimidine-nucleoside phosphorylase [Bacillota bacterium]|nr:pyrimidine-nucleoside phosphorylase [Thermoanaerobacteraceae bacterium]